MIHTSVQISLTICAGTAGQALPCILSKWHARSWQANVWDRHRSPSHADILDKATSSSYYNAGGVIILPVLLLSFYPTSLTFV
ncbi:hypothetical protein B0H13DRAFT_2060474 [Mycena leptocephala]|nr:hypothetical protein B0H13DRAFT_2060474 [Mycena leptocephala]